MAKKRWIEMARKNDEQTTGYLQAMLQAIRSSFYQFLNIKPVTEIIATAEKESGK